jgi:hypothetical protein
MGLGSILKPINHGIEAIQHGAEHVVHEVSHEAPKPIVNTAHAIDEAQKKFIKDIQEKITDELTKKYNDIMHNLEDKYKIIIHNIRDRLLNEVPVLYDYFVEAIRKENGLFPKIAVLILQNDEIKNMIVESIKKYLSDLIEKELL